MKSILEKLTSEEIKELSKEYNEQQISTEQQTLQ